MTKPETKATVEHSTSVWTVVLSDRSGSGWVPYYRTCFKKLQHVRSYLARIKFNRVDDAVIA